VPQPKSVRLSVYGCALAWLVTGLQLGDLLGVIAAGRRPTALAVLLFLGFALLGAQSVHELLRRPAPDAAPDASPEKPDAAAP